MTIDYIRTPTQLLYCFEHTTRIEDGTLYTTDGQRAAALLQRDADIDELLMQALERWTELSDGS